MTAIVLGTLVMSASVFVVLRLISGIALGGPTVHSFFEVAGSVLVGVAVYGMLDISYTYRKSRGSTPCMRDSLATRVLSASVFVVLRLISGIALGGPTVHSFFEVAGSVVVGIAVYGTLARLLHCGEVARLNAVHARFSRR